MGSVAEKRVTREEEETPPKNKRQRIDEMDDRRENFSQLNLAPTTKKLVIKNLKKQPKVPDVFVSKSMAVLERAVIAIQKSEKIDTSLEELYKLVEVLCGQGMAEQVYSKLKELIETHVSEIRGQFLGENMDKLIFMKKMNEVFSNYCQQIKMCRSIFLYLDRKYVLNAQGVLSIWELGLDTFRKRVLTDKVVQTRTVDGSLMLIEQERHGDVIDRVLLKCILRMLSDLQIYKDAFEHKFLAATDRLYSTEGNQLVNDNESPVPEYLAHVQKRLEEECDRVAHYLDSSTRWQLIHIVEKHLIATHYETILNRGLDTLLEENRTADLKLLYSLFKRVKDGLEKLCSKMAEYIQKRGKVIVSDPEKDKMMVQELLEYKEKLDSIIDQCFDNNEKFTTALKDSFVKFINQRQNKPAEMVAKFMDSKLRAGNKESSEEEMERLQDKIMVLFRFIHGKDVFEGFYKKDLAKRLLHGKSASVDSEKSMISKLKIECGAAFTSKLEGMFKDMELSRDINIAFKSQLQSKKIDEDKIDMNVSVLNYSFWPTYPVHKVHIPQFLAKYQEIFNQFYLGKYSGRKLNWQPSLGHCNMRATFKTETKELQISLFQALCLLPFNERDEITFEELKELTNIEDGEIRRTLQSLACGKARVIQKSPKGKDILDGDKFIFNKDFTNPHRKIKINQVQMRETNEEQKATEARVFADRQYLIEAAIIRILKTRKTMSHNLLLTEIYNQLRFPVTPTDVKIRIENLIDRVYMERDKSNPKQYHYVA